MYCEKCGTRLSDDANFCSGCGSRVKRTPVKDNTREEAEKQDKQISDEETTVDTNGAQFEPIESTAMNHTGKVYNFPAINISRLILSVVASFIIGFLCFMVSYGAIGIETAAVVSFVIAEIAAALVKKELRSLVLIIVGIIVFVGVLALFGAVEASDSIFLFIVLCALPNIVCTTIVIYLCTSPAKTK